jgi:lipoyl(octanoyl) transferase
MSAFGNDLHAFLRFLEDAIIDTLADIGLGACRRQGLTGAWVNERKIASIGIAVRRWTSYHGLSIVVKNNGLEDFKHIRPCGMDISMTSVESELHRDVPFDEIKSRLIRSLEYDKCAFACAG